MSDKNSLTVADMRDEIPDDSERMRLAELETDVAATFTKTGNEYKYNGVDVVAFTDHGDSITTNHDTDDVATAMVKVAEIKGWNRTVVDGSSSFYDAAEKQINSAHQVRYPSESVKLDTENTVAVETESGQATEKEQRERLELARRVAEGYDVDGKRYMYRNKGRTPVEAFRDRGNTLVTANNDDRVTASLVDLARAKGWSAIKVSGSKQFRRQAWLIAQSHGLDVRGYVPTGMDLATVKGAVNTVARDTEQKAEPETEQHIDESKPEQRTRRGNRELSGILVDHGAAPYQNKADKKPSYYITVETDTGERTQWGVDLERAVIESGVSVGDQVRARKIESKPVTVEDELGMSIAATRNGWLLTTPAAERNKAQVIKQVGAAVAARVPDQNDVDRINDMISERVDNHDGFMPDVPMYDNTVTKPLTPAPTKQTEKELIR